MATEESCEWCNRKNVSAHADKEEREAAISMMEKVWGGQGGIEELAAGKDNTHYAINLLDEPREGACKFIFLGLRYGYTIIPHHCDNNILRFPRFRLGDCPKFIIYVKIFLFYIYIINNFLSTSVDFNNN